MWIRSTEDGYCHPPAVFSIGADRGFLVYAGQPQACRKCGSTGHNADRCEQMRCRSCGKIGHITKDCKEPRKSDRGFLVYAGQPQACRKCGSTGHNADSCEQMRCRSCGKIGHITKDCKEPRKCHLCDSETHMARDCFLVYAGQPQACRKCGSTGHNADKCEQMRCRSCGKIGHITRDCKEPRTTGIVTRPRCSLLERIEASWFMQGSLKHAGNVVALGIMQTSVNK
uniref:CCHC-type domain-containing protein n=1 Tax=Maylandia zebra TaxID=106582 RepID=A0A3P9DIP1_9CICH